MAIDCVFRNDNGFITDLYSSFVSHDRRSISNELFVPRYGVWTWDDRKGAYQVAFTSDDLDECKRRLA